MIPVTCDNYSMREMRCFSLINYDVLQRTKSIIIKILAFRQFIKLLQNEITKFRNRVVF